MSRTDIGWIADLARGDREGAEELVRRMGALGVERVRVPISWPDDLEDDGRAWHEWLIERLARDVEVVPVVGGTPAGLGILARPSSPLREPRLFSDWLDGLVDRLGACFTWIELWGRPDAPDAWDPTLDPAWRIFRAMIGRASHRMRLRGKRAILGGMTGEDPDFLESLFQGGALTFVDAIGLSGHQASAADWERRVQHVRALVDRYGLPAEIWITEASAGDRPRDRLEALASAAGAGARRVFWRGSAAAIPAGAPQPFEERMLREGRVAEVARLADPAPHGDGPWALVTGGAGFVGSNLVRRLLDDGHDVVVLDDLSRPSVERNAAWLRQIGGERVRIVLADIRDGEAVRAAVRGADQVFHLAAQVAVTTSLDGPVHDFETNARGTLELLEALRARPVPPPLIFSSTNKVYGDLADIHLSLRDGRWCPDDDRVREAGIGTDRPVRFHSPYGCSKGAADQYVLDYAATFGLPATVFRMSCTYGPRQFGNEDQGWVAHFLLRALSGEPLTVYGDGRQVRDVLFVDDLVDAFLAARDHQAACAGRAFNLGGGPGNQLSLLDLVDRVERLCGQRPEVDFEDWRRADQRWYVSDVSAFSEATGWRPRIGLDEGLARLHRWLVGLVSPEPVARSGGTVAGELAETAP